MSFSDKIRRFAKNTKEDIGDNHHKTALEVFARVVRRTPVGDPDLWNAKPPPGYAGGHARANWQMSLNTIPQNEVEGTATPEPIGKKIDIKDTVYIVNNAPYIEVLEDGWSTQARNPNGMVKVTVSEFENIVNGNVRK